MKVYDLQTSQTIREHLGELKGAYDNSRNKHTLKCFINKWTAKYLEALQKENELKQLKNNK